MRVSLLSIFILFSIFDLVIGFFLVIKPRLAIKIQKKFYERINWRIEPISMSKEIRNTRIMGWFLIVLLVATLIFIFLNKPLFLQFRI